MNLDILAKCIFGQDFDTLTGNHAGPLNAYNFCIKFVYSPIRLLIPWWGKLPLPVNRKLRHLLKEFDDYCWSIISAAKIKKSTIQNEENNYESVIDLMIDSDMSESDVRDNVGFFLFAGQDTTSFTLSWAMGLLASHPEIQEKARKEILEKTPDGLNFDSLSELHYIDWIIRETLRLHPPVPITGGRKTTTEVKIGDWNIPENTVIQINFMGMHLDPKIWGDDVEEFRPERWSSENITTKQRTSHMPFGSGPRICLGRNLSLLVQKIFLASLLREYSIQFAKDGQLVRNNSMFLSSPDFDKLKIHCVK